MDGRTLAVNRVVQGHDKYLVAQRERNGAIHIYRKTGRPADPLHFVMAVTENWTINSPPRDWGLTVIENRLKAHDLWSNEAVVNRVEAEILKDAESTERSMKNSVESFLYDFRRQFARATDGINTSSLPKTDKRALKGA